MIDALLADLNPGFPEQHIGEETARHTDAAMDAPDRQIDILCLQGIVPGEDMIVDAVDEGAVEIEQEGSLCYGHCPGFWFQDDQCDMRTGRVMSSSTWRVAPPKTNSRRRLWP